jgi:23S rRNA (uracil1939-C5)-methyltransferase
MGPEGRVFVERSAPGDRLKALVVRDAQGLLRAEPVELVTPSSHRQTPPCVHYEQCGNCTLQHLDEKFYRGWKTFVVRDALRKVGLQPLRWLETAFVPPGTRRRATFTAVKRGNQVSVGFYQRRSQEVTDIQACLVADPGLLTVQKSLARVLSPMLRQDQPVDVFLQKVLEGVDMVVTGPIGKSGQPDRAVAAGLGSLMQATPVVRVSWRPHEGETPRVICGAKAHAQFGALRVPLPPAAFMQPTPEGEAALVAAVLKALPDGGMFADLFSGCGTFAGPMLQKGSVDAFEAVPGAVNALFSASRGSRLKVFRRDLFNNPLRRDEINRFDAVVFDPPRAGCEAQAFEMARAKAGVLISVSCNPATFSRDARVLVDGGYWLRSIQVIDQFAWSHHVEVVGVFTKDKRASRASNRY